VNGKGSFSVPISQAVVTLAVQASAPTAVQAQQAASNSITQVFTVLQSFANVTQLQTIAVQLSPIFRNQTIVGYTYFYTLRFSSPVQSLGVILDQTVAAGVNSIQSITFVPSDTDVNLAQQVAISLALRDAQSQADVTLGQLGLSQQEILAIVVNPSLAVLSSAQQAVGSSAVPIVGGEQEVTATVILQISY